MPAGDNTLAAPTYWPGSSTLITSSAERVTSGTGSKISAAGLLAGIDHDTTPSVGKQPMNIALFPSSLGMVTQLVPARQSLVWRHRSTQCPSVHVPLRQSCSTVHVEPAVPVEPSAIQVDNGRLLLSSSAPLIWHDNPAAQSTSLWQALSSCPEAGWQIPLSHE
jgi:hypothetical protein